MPRNGIGTSRTQKAWERYGSTANDFESVFGETSWTMGFRRGEWAVRVVTHTRLTCTAEDFVVHARLDAYEGDVRVHSENWCRRMARDHV